MGMSPQGFGLSRGWECSQAVLYLGQHNLQVIKHLALHLLYQLFLLSHSCPSVHPGVICSDSHARSHLGSGRASSQQTLRADTEQATKQTQAGSSVPQTTTAQMTSVYLQQFAPVQGCVSVISRQCKEETRKDPGVFQEMIIPLPAQLFPSVNIKVLW